VANLTETAVAALRTELFASPERSTYMLLDGAATRAILEHLYSDRARFTCLLTGELEPDMLEVAPYLVELKTGDPFTHWITASAFGNHWGIAFGSDRDLSSLARHFRQLLFVRDAEGDVLFFRYYDPRVFRVYLPTCHGEDLTPWFTPVDYYWVEAEGPDALLRFSYDGSDLNTQEIRLA
jgi:hypothetical protein